ncbi:MAG TPA: alpha/beta fold hydrolase [Acidimicrobiales bacterium]|nr:alpha/beta fold hydrolase [Acidimicrobiales bacterium]
MAIDLLEGAEPFSGGEGANAVLLLHGFTGQPYTMRSLANAFLGSGFRVELPRLPGHGTSVEDLESCRFADWTESVDAIYLNLARSCARVVLVGLSMGGTLGCWLAERYREIAGLILINPLIEPTTKANMDALHTELREGRSTFSSPGSDIKCPGRAGPKYDATPIRPLLSLLEGAITVRAKLDQIVAPILLFSSREDHVVPCSTGDTIVRQVQGDIERVYLENSYHVATLDYDAPELETRSVAFSRKVVGI